MEMRAFDNIPDNNPKIKYIEFLQKPIIKVKKTRNGEVTWDPRLCEKNDQLTLEAYVEGDNIKGSNYDFNFWSGNDGRISTEIIIKSDAPELADGEAQYTFYTFKKYILGTGVNMKTFYCPGSARVLVSYLPQPPVQITNVIDSDGEIKVKKGESVALKASGAVTYKWYLGNNQIAEGAGFSVTPVIDGNYKVIGTNSSRCSVKDSINIKVVLPDRSILDAKNVITPNGDGKNDTWMLENPPMYSQCEVIIYNSWGKQIYTQDGVKANGEAWDGKSSEGDELPAGTYYYKVREKNGDKEYTGFITLFK
jgi:gliding motility-associated-like protein